MTTVAETEIDTTSQEDQSSHDCCAICFPPELYNYVGAHVTSLCGVLYEIEHPETVDLNNQLPFNCDLCEKVFHEHFNKCHPWW